MSKIMVVGDLHGDWGKLNALIAQKQPEYVLQCGDFGWWPALEIKRPVLYGQQKPWKLKGVKPGKANVFWCDGNHEDHWALKRGEPGRSYEKVMYMPRGSTISLPDGRVVLFMGGASSIDRSERTMGVDWFPDEIISYPELDEALAHDRVDIVISHTCPVEFSVRCNNGSDGKNDDPCRVALSAILKKYKPGLWVFGHWHRAQEGRHNNTYWQCLDYPGHGGRWWNWVKC